MATAIWMSLEEAAPRLGVSTEALKKRLQLVAKRSTTDGAIEARPAPGIKGRKLGRFWRVCLSEGWANDH